MIETVRGELTCDRMQELLRTAGVGNGVRSDQLRFQTVKSDAEYRPQMRVVRHNVWAADEAIASIKQIPRVAAFDHDAIIAVYANYSRAQSFRLVKLLGYQQDDSTLWLVEEFARGLRTLDECVANEWFSPEEATERIVAIVNDVWSLGSACRGDAEIPELDDLEPAFRQVFESRVVADSLYRSFREMFRWCGGSTRDVLSTRDYIGRNIAVMPDGDWLLLDTDLSRRTRCFNLSILRARLHTPFDTERLRRADALQGWDHTLLELGMLAAEYQLQTSLQPARLHEATLDVVRRQARHLLEPRFLAVSDTRDESLSQHAAELSRLRAREQSLVGEVNRLGSEGHALVRELALRQDHVVNLESVIRRLTEDIARHNAETGAHHREKENECARLTSELQAQIERTSELEIELRRIDTERRAEAARLQTELEHVSTSEIRFREQATTLAAQCATLQAAAHEYMRLAETLAPAESCAADIRRRLAETCESINMPVASNGIEQGATAADGFNSVLRAARELIERADETGRRLLIAESEIDTYRGICEASQRNADSMIGAATAREAQLAAQLADKDRHIQNVEAIVHDIQNSRAWWWLSAWRRFRHELWRRPRATLKMLLSEGPRIVRLHARLGGSPRSIAAHYDEWLMRHDRQPDREEADRILAGLAHQPLISIVMPTYNTRPEWLVAAIQSVQRQLYSNWELCIADDCSTSAAVRATLDLAARDDARIKLAYRAANGGISAASNDALALAAGEWTALLDHDDELPPHALLEVVRAINDSPTVDLIYSDEDKLDENGRRCEPHFKPDWAPDTLLCLNYVCHLLVCRTSIVRDVGGFRAGYDGSQDYDLLLRVTERTRSVRHIPRILYHWRKSAQSTSQNVASKGYAEPSAKRALTDAMQRRGIEINGVDIGIVPTTYRIRYAIRGEPTVHMIIPTRNNQKYLERCVNSIVEKTRYPNYQLHIIDNGSDDRGTLDYLAVLRGRERMCVHEYPKPFNYSAINNWAARRIDGQYLLLLNDDTEVISPDWLTAMMEHACRTDVGAVGARLVYSDGRLQHAGVVLGIGGVAGHSHKYADRREFGYMGRVVTIQNYSAVTAACLLTRRDVFESVNGLNERELAVAFNDVDFCLRVREKGYNIVYTPYAELFHHESVSRGLSMNPNEVAYMKERWTRQLERDPFYNCNLTLEHEDFSLRLSTP